MISLKQVEKIYRTSNVETLALRNINIEIPDGALLSIMGPSGSGKSTLLNIMGLIDVPSEGEVQIGGQNVAGMSEKELAHLRNKMIGFVFQSFHLIPELNVVDNVELPLLYNSTLRSKERRALALKALDIVGLTDRQEHTPSQLSGGQQQRVAIARALVNDPLVILADEATGNLDTRTSYEIMALFQELNKQGKTIVFVTHEPDIARCIKRSVIFRDGHIIREGNNEKPVDANELLMNLPRNSEYD